MSNTQVQKIQIHKYTNTAYDKVQEGPTCGIYLTRGSFKDMKYDNPITAQKHKYKIYKYKNTAYEEVPERQGNTKRQMVTPQVSSNMAIYTSVDAKLYDGH